MVARTQHFVQREIEFPEVFFEDVSGLEAEDLALLRRTRPVRDPLDVVEEKIRGEPEVEAGDRNEESGRGIEKVLGDGLVPIQEPH
jgi:hypothetical protein